MPGYKKSLESRMRSVSLDCNKDNTGHGKVSAAGGGGGGGAAVATSQYHQNFQPMLNGLRIQTWQEGWQQRCERKKNGFNHFTLEWIVPTDRR